MAFSFVGTGGTVVAEFDFVAMSPTVSIRVKADFRASGWGTSRGLLRGRWCFVGK